MDSYTMLPEEPRRSTIHRTQSKDDVRSGFDILTSEVTAADVPPSHDDTTERRETWFDMHEGLPDRIFPSSPRESSPSSSSKHAPRKISILGRIQRSVTTGSLDLAAAFSIFWYYLITFETVVVFCNTILATSIYYFINIQGQAPFIFNYNLSWALVSFAIISPVIMQIQQAYSRREAALLLIAESTSYAIILFPLLEKICVLSIEIMMMDVIRLYTTCVSTIIISICKSINSTAKALMLNFYMAHHQWLRRDQQDLVPPELIHRSRILVRGIMYELCDLLSSPTITRGRHRFTSSGVKEHRAHVPKQQLLRRRIACGLRKLHKQVRDLKDCGLSDGAASRLYQYLWMIHSRILSLINIKVG